MSEISKATRLPFTPAQRRILLALACSVGLRMLGLFLVLPVFTLYGLQFTSSKVLVGFAFGAYALTMGLLQIPMGRLSDHHGRRIILILGTAIFVVGSILCAVPHWFPLGARIWVLVSGRLVQGCGATISAAFAAVADSIEPERRSTAMAVLGIPIGLAAVVGVVAGPLIAAVADTSFLFWLSGLLGLATLWLLVRYLPAGAPSAELPAPLRQMLSLRPLLALDVAGFLMNFFMSTFFVPLPLIMHDRFHLTMMRYSLLLLPMIAVSGFTMFGFSIGADRGRARPLAALAFLLFTPYSVLLFKPEIVGLNPNQLAIVLIGGTLFYIAFTGLEPILPSLVSKTAPGSAYGTALGVYNTTQFLGSFVGGPVAGALATVPRIYTVTVLMAASILGLLLMVSSPER